MEISYSIIKKSQLDGGRRLDAEFYEREVLEFLKQISQRYKVSKLSEFISFINHGKQPPYVEDGEVPIITQRHLGNIFVDLEALADPDTKYTSRDWLKAHSTFKLRPDDILYYSVGAYIGKTNIILEDIEAVPASFITLIRVKKGVDPLYLVTILNSPIGTIQSDRWKRASAQPYIYPNDIRQFLIPVLPKGEQGKIADLVRKSYGARSQAKQFLEQAKDKVEKVISNKKIYEENRR